MEEAGSGYYSGRPRMREQTKRILTMRQQGMVQRSIAETLGCSIDAVRNACRKYGLSIEQKPLTEDDARSVIDRAGYDYVSGFSNVHSKVIIRCRECGGTFDKMYKHLHAKANGTYKYKMTCPHCLKQKQDDRLKQKQDDAERDARIKAEQRAMREAELISRQTEERLAIHVCKNCGQEFCIALTGYNSSKYCSEKCMKRWAMRIKNDRRLKRMRSRKHDTDITLEKLFVRDGGVCYLCGMRCDWDDVTDGNAGDSYPSIDHVRPLSKGGTHEWNNVKLAHRKCNWAKRDTDIAPLG